MIVCGKETADTHKKETGQKTNATKLSKKFFDLSN